MPVPQPHKVPDSFEFALRTQFDGRFRVRWSRDTAQWHIEQRVGRKRPTRSARAESDQAIRWRDGYEFVLAVTPGDHTWCAACGTEFKVPVLEMRYPKCPTCGKEQRACHYPLGDALLEHLRYIDPDRGGIMRVAHDVEAADFAKEFWDTRRAKGARRDAIWDERKSLFDIQQVGYTGKWKS